MVQTLNFISLSSQQAPNDVDWSGLVKAGVQGALIRLGHGIIRDPCASGHIAKAKQYGLYWHGYHTYEGVVNEPQFTIKNATELGLSNSQYYFVDLTNSSDPVNDYYALHATWLSQGYSTGLLISNKDYLSKFTDSEVTASGTLRWLISDNVPSNYDVWQYSSEGTVGTSSVKVGFNFSKTDKLKYNLDTTLTGADFNKDPYNPETPVGGAYIGWGYDTTGLGGGKTIGYSTNGKNFYALIGPDGLIVRKSDGDRIYGTISDQINSAISANVIPAKSAADSAVSAADAAVASAQVTSDAVSAIASATAEAKQGANDALSRAKSAWDVATNAKSAVTDFDPLLKSAQSDASKALTQIADTASALSDAKLAFNSDVAEVKNLANTAQATADSAVKSASSVADDLTAVANQAKTNANGITKVTSDVGLLQTTVADNSGNISTIQETAKQIQQAVSDNAGNITVAKQTADSAVAVASDARSNATVAIQTASQASITASNASGQAASSVLTANGALTTASNANSNATVAVQTASGASLTAINANSDATVAKQTASEAKVQASNAESDFAQLSIRAGQIEASVANNSGAIANVQQTANGLTTTVANITSNGGGRNLLIGTSDDWVTKTASGSMNVTTANDTKTSVADYHDGDKFTYSATITNNSDTNVRLEMFCCDSNGTRLTGDSYHISSDSVAPNTTAKKVSCTIAISWNTWFVEHTLIADDGTSTSKTVQIKGEMFEAGTIAHDWSPAPEDAQNQFTQIKQSIDGVTTTINDPKTGLNATYQTAAGNATTISNVKSDVYQLQTTANGLTSRVGNLESKTNTQETEIQQNKNAITLKADQTDVNTLKGNVTSLQAEVTTQANEITTKVTQSDVTGMLAGYATQDYTQSLVTQKADEWNLNLTKLQGDTQTSLTNLSTTVDGIKSTVATKADQSTVTELSNLVQTKVSSGDFTSTTTQLKNLINQRVQVGDVISQINQEAGGNTLIQVANGNGKLVLNANSVVFTGDAFIPDAYISTINADKLMFYGSDGTSATMGASVAQYDDDKTKSTINLQYSGGIEIHSSDQQGSILTMHDNTIRLASKSWGDNPNAYQYSGFYAAPNYSLMNTYHRDGTTSGVAIDDNQIHIYGSSKDQQLGALKADVGWYSINGKTGLLTGNQIALKATTTQVTLSDRNINIENTIDTNSNNYDVAIHIKGWAEMTGWFTCMGITQTSLLSAKTRIEPLDTKVALDKIASTNVETYQFKSDVAKGKTKRHASVIIDDVHDVAEYYTPEEFISENRMGRDDGDIIGYLMGAVQELKKQLDELKEKI